ncbi:MAG: hypothetical protein ABR582_11690 [Gemmatimonadaceae bacterium]
MFSLIAAGWLALLVTEPTALHVCAVHADGMSHAAAPHSAHFARMPGHGKTPSHEHSSKCTCLGAASYANAVVIPRTDETLFCDAPVATVAELPATADVLPPPSAPFFLPYSNGPPVTIAS